MVRLAEAGPPPAFTSVPFAEHFREVLRPGGTGWMFQAGNLDEAVSQVLARSRDEATLRQVGSAARTYITEHRQWRHNILQLQDFVAEVADRP